jgi:Ca2+-binding EF-hand superfamily protein
LDLTEIAQLLKDAFASADTNEDDQLSFAEAQAAFNPLTEDQFTSLDEDADGFLSLEELEAQLEPENGCFSKSGATTKLNGLLGDLFLLSLAITALLASSQLRRE